MLCYFLASNFIGNVELADIVQKSCNFHHPAFFV